MLRERLLTALVMAVCLIAAVLYAPARLTAAVLGLIVLAGGWEWSAFLRAPIALRAAYVALVALAALLGLKLLVDTRNFLLLMSLAALGWCLALLWILLAPSRAPRWAAGLAGVLALVPTWLALVRIDAHWPRGAQWTLFVLLLAFAADTGAFFAGRRFGRHRLAPRVSPAKTWEGVAGGLSLAALAALAGAHWFALPWLPFLGLCLLAGVFSIVGDLTESLLKRNSGLKDSGRLFPGHGGVLDRIDSVTAATPVMWLGLWWLGVGA
ncbi:MAG: phosphatidate cytidylyltransferase [Steroidobacteraceae bacterium]